MCAKRAAECGLEHLRAAACGDCLSGLSRVLLLGAKDGQVICAC